MFSVIQRLAARLTSYLIRASELVQGQLAQGRSNKGPSSLTPSVDLQKFWVTEWGLHGRGPFGCPVPCSPSDAHLIWLPETFRN